MRALLETYNNFQECILLDVRWEHYGYKLDLVFHYIWASGGAIRKNLDQPHLLHVVFEGVHEFHVRNAWTDAMFEEPASMNWGASEVALVRVENDPKYVGPYGSSGREAYHVCVYWEGDRRIDIVFTSLSVRQ